MQRALVPKAHVGNEGGKRLRSAFSRVSSENGREVKYFCHVAQSSASSSDYDENSGESAAAAAAVMAAVVFDAAPLSSPAAVGVGVAEVPLRCALHRWRWSDFPHQMRECCLTC
jgi:hypothetical protein